MGRRYATRVLQLILADILTQDPARPTAAAVLCSSGRILSVGGRQEVESQAHKLAGGREVRTLDYRGYTLSPALIDAHIHLVSYGFSLARLRLENCKNVFELQLALRERITCVPEEWIEGEGWSLSGLGLVEYPHKAWLNEICADQPVVLHSRDLHSVWVNSRAMQLAGVSSSTPDPEGGKIVRDGNGKPTGTFLEAAQDLILKVMPRPSERDYLDAGRRAALRMRQYGYGAVHTLAFEPPEALAALSALENRGELPLRVWAALPYAQLEAARSLGLRGGFGGNITLGGIKFFADGTLGSRTAWMRQPYPGGGNGLPLDKPSVILEKGREALELGFSPCVHAIGDRACGEVLEVFAQLTPLAREKGVKLRLEHGQHLHPEDVARAAQMGVVVSMQPLHLPGDIEAIERLVPQLAPSSYATHSLLSAGALVCFGSDAPVAAPDPQASFKAAVERGGFQMQEAITPLEWLHGHTRAAAMAVGWRDLGWVREDALADFTLWDVLGGESRPLRPHELDPASLLERV